MERKRRIAREREEREKIYFKKKYGGRHTRICLHARTNACRYAHVNTHTHTCSRLCTLTHPLTHPLFTATPAFRAVCAKAQSQDVVIAGTLCERKMHKGESRKAFMFFSTEECTCTKT